MATALAFCWSAAVFGDEVELTDNRRISGKILEETDDFIKVRTIQGEITLLKSRVKNVIRETRIQAEVDGDLAAMQKDYRTALDLYRQAYDEHPDSQQLAEKIRNLESMISDRDLQARQALFDEAMVLVQRKNRAGAREILEQIVAESEPDSAGDRRARRAIAYTYLLDSLAHRDRVENQLAIRCLEEAVKVDPTLPVVQLERAHLLSAYTSNVDVTLAAFRMGLEEGARYVALDPRERDRYKSFEPPEARFDEGSLRRYQYEYGVLLFNWGKTQEAARVFLDLLKGDMKVFTKVESDRIIKYIVDAYTDPATNRALEFDRATLHEQLDTALALDPSVTRGWFFKGRLYLDDDRTTEAVKMLTRAIEVGQNVPELYLNRAKANIRLHEYELARRDLEREISIQDSYAVRCMLADVSLRCSEYDAALEQLTKAVEMEPEQLPALILRARAYRLQAMTTGVSPTRRDELLLNAKRDLELVYFKNNKSREAVLELGRVLRDGKMYAEAEKWLNQVIGDLRGEETTATLSVDDKGLLAEAYVERGGLLLDGDNRNRAEEDFRNALKIQPNCAIAFNRLGQVAEKQLNYEKARENYAKAIELDPKSAEFELSMAQVCHTFLKEYERAIEHYEAYRRKGGVNLKLNSWISQCETALQAK
ncbi:tetratricopeptide repeat protein [Candidatus Sumerlaeota bacterium]|nr:tetratricopeptide repeat protein [Candidatus Sumerlaeota bacterium]